MFFIGLHCTHLLPSVASAGDSDEDDYYTPPLPPDLTASHPYCLPRSWAFVALKERIEYLYTVSQTTLHVGPQPLPAANASQIEGKEKETSGRS